MEDRDGLGAAASYEDGRMAEPGVRRTGSRSPVRAFALNITDRFPESALQWAESIQKRIRLSRRRVCRRDFGGGNRLRCFHFAGIPGAFAARQRAENDVEVAVAQHFRRGICLAISGDLLDKLVHHLEAEFFVRPLAST